MDEGRVLHGNIKYHLLNSITLATKIVIYWWCPTTG